MKGAFGDQHEASKSKEGALADGVGKCLLRFEGEKSRFHEKKCPPVTGFGHIRADPSKKVGLRRAPQDRSGEPPNPDRPERLIYGTSGEALSFLPPPKKGKRERRGPPRIKTLPSETRPASQPLPWLLLLLAYGVIGLAILAWPPPPHSSILLLWRDFSRENGGYREPKDFP